MKDMDEALRSMDFEFYGRGEHKTSHEALFKAKDALLLDLRSDEERKIVNIQLPWIPTLHIPLHELPGRWTEIPEDRPVGLFCSSDTRSTMAFAYLYARGYRQARILLGGYGAMSEALKPGKLYARLKDTP